MRALILSAGLGERLRPLTLKRAKPAIEFLNMPMLAFPYFGFERLGLSEIVFNTHYLPESVRHAALQVVSPEVQLHLTHEPRILGSGGGIWNARNHLQGTEHFAVANGDAVVAFKDAGSLMKMLAAHHASGALATMLVCPLEGVGTTIPGVWIKTGDGGSGSGKLAGHPAVEPAPNSVTGEVLGFGKSSPVDGAVCRHYASFMFLSERVWKYLPEGESNILYDVFVSAMKAGEKILAFEDRDLRWFETGNAADYLRATETCLSFLKDGDAYGANLRAMLERFVPDFELFSELGAMRLRAQATSGKQTGFCVIGNDVCLNAGLRLENSVILPGATAGGVIRNQVII